MLLAVRSRAGELPLNPFAELLYSPSDPALAGSTWTQSEVAAV